MRASLSNFDPRESKVHQDSKRYLKRTPQSPIYRFSMLLPKYDMLGFEPSLFAFFNGCFETCLCLLVAKLLAKCQVNNHLKLATSALAASNPRSNVYRTIFSNFTNLLWGSELHDQFLKSCWRSLHKWMYDQTSAEHWRFNFLL